MAPERVAHRRILASLGSVGVLWASAAVAQNTPPDYDFQFATIGATGNAAYQSSDRGQAQVNGRGSVSYSYRMSSLEVTTGQWVEFLNTFKGRTPNQYWKPSYVGPWGADGSASAGYRLRSDIPNAGMLPVFGITWRMAGMYCNWLNNGKSSALSSLLSGAYDTSTWGTTPGTREITDAPTHQAGAKYWIPTLDEQLKAFYYDPARYGAGQGGWWQYTNGSDAPGVSGLPGQGTTSLGVTSDGWWKIPLGAYPNSKSPWGLLDTSGGAAEWNEELYPGGGHPRERGYCSSAAGNTEPGADWIAYVSSADPDFAGCGLRIASDIPSPGTIMAFALPLVLRPRSARAHAR